jgi:acetyltransferase-like isoleucine patch superfamily enzyme
MLPPGLDLNLQQAAGLDPGSSFELPCVVQAQLGQHRRIDVGAFTAIYGGSLGAVRIGRFCSIAPGCMISPDEHPTGWLSTSMMQYVPDLHGWNEAIARIDSQFNAPLPAFGSSRAVVIGNDVWLGHGAFIRGGVRIGDGAIVGAGSIVVKDVPAYHIVGGNPARVIRPRFRQAVIERLQRLEWWNYDVFRIPNLDFSSVERAIGLIERAIAHRIVTTMTPHVVTAADLAAA